MASQVSALFLRDDFPELVDAVGNHLGINPAIIEKDYYVTEALRKIASVHGQAIMFKGGTSLSKGWGLIHRFSEDIDLYIDPANRGIKARNSLLKSVIADVASHPAFTGEPEKVAGVDGVARAARIAYTPRHNTGLVAPSVLIELGVQSGTFPHETRPVTSLLAEQLVQAGNAPNQEDCLPFDLKLLHFRRTLIEKMFALHDKVQRGLIQSENRIGGYARHFYDLSQLLARTEVQQMLGSSEYAEIVCDYHSVTRRFFPHQVFPENLELAQSPALFPPDGIRASLARDYAEQCQALCYREFPSFDEVLGMLELARRFLIPVRYRDRLEP
jgi:hypothetical protein